MVSALGRKPARRRESPLARLAHIAVMGAAFVLLNSDDWPLLRARFVPAHPVVDIVGIVLTAAGLAFSVWARHVLGTNWSADVTIRQDHTLIRSGPYAWIRHPIYSGMLVALVGTAVVIGEVRALLAVTVVTVGFIFKAKKEDRFLAEEFRRGVRGAQAPDRISPSSIPGSAFPTDKLIALANRMSRYRHPSMD